MSLVWSQHSNTQRTINKSVVRNDIGRLQVRQCLPVLRTQRAVSRWLLDSQRKTVVDILNKLQQNKQKRSIVTLQK